MAKKIYIQDDDRSIFNWIRENAARAQDWMYLSSPHRAGRIVIYFFDDELATLFGIVWSHSINHEYSRS